MDRVEAFKRFLAPEVTTLVTSVSETGVINVSPTDWCHKISYDPQILLVCKKLNSDTATHLAKVGKQFVVSVPPASLAEDVLQCARPIPITESELAFPDLNLKIKFRSGDLVSLEGMLWEAFCLVREIKDVGTHRLFFSEVQGIQTPGDEADLNREELLHVKFKTFARIGRFFDAKGW